MFTEEWSSESFNEASASSYVVVCTSYVVNSLFRVFTRERKFTLTTRSPLLSKRERHVVCVKYQVYLKHQLRVTLSRSDFLINLVRKGWGLRNFSRKIAMDVIPPTRKKVPSLLTSSFFYLVCLSSILSFIKNGKFPPLELYNLKMYNHYRQ